MESGRFFDDQSHFKEVLNVAKQAKKDGAVAVGLFGSRLRGTQRIGESDTDLLILKENVVPVGEYHWSGRDKRIQIVTIPPNLLPTNQNSRFLLARQKEARWIWKKRNSIKPFLL